MFICYLNIFSWLSQHFLPPKGPVPSLKDVTPSPPAHPFFCLAGLWSSGWVEHLLQHGRDVAPRGQRAPCPTTWTVLLWCLSALWVLRSRKGHCMKPPWFLGHKLVVWCLQKAQQHLPCQQLWCRCWQHTWVLAEKTIPRMSASEGG